MKQEQGLKHQTEFVDAIYKSKKKKLILWFRFAQLFVSHFWDIQACSAKMVRLVNKHTNISTFLVKIYEKIKIFYLSAFHSNFADKIRAIVILIRHNSQFKLSETSEFKTGDVRDE